MNVGHMRRDCGADTGARRLFTAPVPPTFSEGKAWQKDCTQPNQVSEPTTDVTGVPAPTEEAPPVSPPQMEEPVVSAAPVGRSGRQMLR